MQWLAALLLSVLVVIAPACGGAGGEKEESAKPADETASPVSEEGKSWGGWRWKGRRQDCFFLYKNRCFSSLKKACQAARCKREGADCVYDDSAPAHVSCEQ